jgi:hypothetical protein
MAGGHACVAGIHEFWRNPPKVGDRCGAKPTPEATVPANAATVAIRFTKLSG